MMVGMNNITENKKESMNIKFQRLISDRYGVTDIKVIFPKYFKREPMLFSEVLPNALDVVEGEDPQEVSIICFGEIEDVFVDEEY